MVSGPTCTKNLERYLGLQGPGLQNDIGKLISILFLQNFNLPSEPLRLPPSLIENNDNLPGSGNGNDVNLTGNRDHMYASDAELVTTQTVKGQLISE